MTTLKKVHMIGIGGINMSAVAKLLLVNKIEVTGSDAAENEATRELSERGVTVHIGHSADFVGDDVDVVIYSSAVPEQHAERQAAVAKAIPAMTNFAFLGEWTKEKRTILVTGTHGKSTTTAMLGCLLVDGQLDPTVIVGSRVPGFVDGNIRLGASDIYLIEGDEYAKHFLEFTPDAIILNNIELDHTDVFKDLEDMKNTFRELMRKIKPSGRIIANVDDENIRTLIDEEHTQLTAKSIHIITFGQEEKNAPDNLVKRDAPQPGQQVFHLSKCSSPLTLTIPGAMNVMNASGAATMAATLGVSDQVVQTTLQGFTGIWRRFERIEESNGILVISDYGHHPTAVHETLEAARDFYPGKRLVLCFQPHHRNRTRHLFDAFIPSFDIAEVLILCEIYDVAGRDSKEDAAMSSQMIVDAVKERDKTHHRERLVQFAKSPEESLTQLKSLVQPNDLVLIMSAGDLYKIAPHIV